MNSLKTIMIIDDDSDYVDATRRILVQYDWPGNVRELENAIERAVVLVEGNVIGQRDIFHYPAASMDGVTAPHKEKSLADIEKEHIIRTLETFDRHKGKTAEALGIDRKTLRAKMRNYRILN